MSDNSLVTSQINQIVKSKIEENKTIVQIYLLFNFSINEFTNIF